MPPTLGGSGLSAGIATPAVPCTTSAPPMVTARTIRRTRVHMVCVLGPLSRSQRGPMFPLVVAGVVVAVVGGAPIRPKRFQHCPDVDDAVAGLFGPDDWLRGPD